MRMMGFALVIIGLIALVYGGISYNRERTVIDLGPIQATATEHHNIPFSPIVGGLLVLGGVFLLVTRRRQIV
jgi:hypothetical protein